MDLRMPGMNGLEAVRLLRARGSKAAIIAVTASGLADTEDEAREAGADAFVRKPYREGELLSIIGEQLGVRYVYDSPNCGDWSPGSRYRRRDSTLSQRLSDLPPALIEQLRDAAIEGRARRLEVSRRSGTSNIRKKSRQRFGPWPGTSSTTRSCRRCQSRTSDDQHEG